MAKPEQDLVSFDMAVSVVECLEIVKVRQKKGQRLFIAVRPIHLHLELMIKMPGIVKLCGVIDDTEFSVFLLTLPQLIFYLLALGDVTLLNRLAYRLSFQSPFIDICMGLKLLRLLDLISFRKTTDDNCFMMRINFEYLRESLLAIDSREDINISIQANQKGLVLPLAASNEHIVIAIRSFNQS